MFILRVGEGGSKIIRGVLEENIRISVYNSLILDKKEIKLHEHLIMF